MKAKLHKLLGTTMLGLALLSQGIPAWAGQSSLPQVNVSPTLASGSVVGARYSADTQQYIGCHFSNFHGPLVTCTARNSTGQTLVCYSEQWGIAAAAKAITDSSRIAFRAELAPGVCDLLYVENYSDYLR